MTLRAQFLEPVANARVRAADAGRCKQTSPLHLLCNRSCLDLAGLALLVDLQPEPDGVLVGEVQLNQLPVEELMAQESHA